ncbi:DEAD/DEAH box helicase [Xenorhabdus bovienii]|uniref:DEAD/DEAH box helicase n=1 Tax=Xenorhabdus bovienii TaxID=40576 RepID=UPI0023B22B7C|nr:DEAD/DEAH box helicase [Xenorhabdus bovienii]MDE9494504.1 DEAD/DEAH box helicase [Xenorhabdus bovienii]MDE9502901.1 DEAD/DEAH box helicase [Xenorhabdus bovienii]MDE9526551.1 DEAD/DEAH box helicase [Xenorhabdus bovienii]
MDLAIVYNAVNAIISENADESVKKCIQETLSYEIAGAEFTSSGWDGKSTMFNWSNRSFPSGFVQAVKKKLEAQGNRVLLKRKPMVEPLGLPNPKINNFPYNPDYVYQDETVERMVNIGGMISQIATGGGKSNIACKATARINRLTLFITTRSVLMHQMRDNFQRSIDFRAENGEPHLKGEKVGIIGDGMFHFSRHVNVATIQTLASFLDEYIRFVEKLPPKGKTLKKPHPTKEEQRREWEKKREFHYRRQAAIKMMLKETCLLILEEAHESSGNSFYDVSRMCVNADYRLGLTATPFMKDSAEANMRLMAVTGSIGIKVSEKYLIDRGILAKPYFLYLRTDYVADEARIKEDLAEKVGNSRLGRTSPYTRAAQLGITYNLARNRLIVRHVKDMFDHKLTVMVLVRLKRHGQILKEMLGEVGIRAEFIFGESKQKERIAQLNKLRNREIDVLIGSTILDVGVDVPGVGGVVLAGGGKAEVELRQRVGRGLRKKTDQANICFVVDFLDYSNNHLLQHSFERRAIIRETDGFHQGMLPEGSKLPFHLLDT